MQNFETTKKLELEVFLAGEGFRTRPPGETLGKIAPPRIGVKRRQFSAITPHLFLPLCFLLAACQEKTSLTDSQTPQSDQKSVVVAEADNTAKNARDRNDATLTPGDQGNSPADREISQKIRKALVTGPGDYSITAKNVKIITINGKVTLRGPVKTDAEKTGITTLAKGIAGEGNVEDQLEVKVNP